MYTYTYTYRRQQQQHAIAVTAACDVFVITDSGGCTMCQPGLSPGLSAEEGPGPAGHTTDRSGPERGEQAVQGAVAALPQDCGKRARARGEPGGWRLVFSRFSKIQYQFLYQYSSFINTLLTMQ